MQPTQGTFLGITPVSSASNGLYFLALPPVSVMSVIYTSKGMSKKFGVRVIYRKIRYLLFIIFHYDVRYDHIEIAYSIVIYIVHATILYSVWRWLTKPKHVAADKLLIKLCLDLFLQVLLISYSNTTTISCLKITEILIMPLFLFPCYYFLSSNNLLMSHFSTPSTKFFPYCVR